MVQPSFSNSPEQVGGQVLRVGLRVSLTHAEPSGRSGERGSTDVRGHFEDAPGERASFRSYEPGNWVV
eukprot:2907291-Pyramimonas_sp.AAC.1